MRALCFAFFFCISVLKFSKCDYPFEVYEKNGAIGSSLMVPGTNPYQVAILRRLQYNYGISDGLKFACGGSLIAPKWVLTAAQCVDFPDPFLKVMLGVTNIRKFERFYQTFDISRKNMIIHPEYQKGILDNDIALIKLPKGAVVNQHVQPVSLPDINDRTYVDSTVFVSGWRTANSFSPVADFLRQITVKVIPNKQCQAYIPLQFTDITNNQLCTIGGAWFSEFASCLQDTGAPLIIFNSKNSRPEQIGILSRTPFNCTGQPTIYTKTSSFRSWIAEEIDKETKTANTDVEENSTEEYFIVPGRSVPEKLVSKGSVLKGSVSEPILSGGASKEFPPAVFVSEASIPEGSVPEGFRSAPEEAAPEESTPEESTSEESTPEEPVPQAFVPEEYVPEGLAPEATIPEVTISEESSPQGTTSEGSVPKESVPEESDTEETVSEGSAPEKSIPKGSAKRGSISKRPIPIVAALGRSIPERYYATQGMTERS